MSYVPSIVCSQVSKNIGGNNAGGVLLWGGLTYHTFSRSTMHAIETGLSPKMLYREIVAALAFHMYSHTQYPTSKEYNQVRLLQKCPVLKDTIGIFLHTQFAWLQ